MAGVIAQDCHRLLSIPERQQRDLRVDDPFRLGAQCRISGRGETRGAHLSVGPQDPSIGRDFFHFSLSLAIVRDRLCRGDRQPQRVRGARDHLPVKVPLEPTIIRNAHFT
jgi:hypothetical protein